MSAVVTPELKTSETHTTFKNEENKDPSNIKDGSDILFFEKKNVFNESYI